MEARKQVGTTVAEVHWRLLQVEVVCVCLGVCARSYPTLCNPVDWRPPGSSVYGIFQARVLDGVAISYSRGSSRPRDRTCISCIGRWILYSLSHSRSPLQRQKEGFIQRKNPSPPVSLDAPWRKGGRDSSVHPRWKGGLGNGGPCQNRTGSQ